MDLNAFDRKVLTDFSLADGHLKTIPAQRKKLLAVLRHVVQSFEPGVHYSEKQVNEIPGRFHEDTVTLRRELVGAQLEYWRVETEKS
jgi:hypothetical protein